MDGSLGCQWFIWKLVRPRSWKDAALILDGCLRELRDQGKCTTGPQRRVRRWEHEDIIERVQQRLDDDPNKMSLRCQTVEHPFGTIKAWMGATHFKMKTLKRVAT